VSSAYRNVTFGAQRGNHSYMHRLLWVASLIAISAPPGRTAQNHPFGATVDATVPALLNQYASAGAAVALIQHGEVTWARGYGFADVASATRVTTETIFNVGSISKSLCAWGVMRLAERGLIDLDRPLDTYLKRWRLPPSNFDNSQVTIRRLLSHTAGISIHDYHGWDPQLPLPKIADSLSGKTGTGEVRVVSAPGSAFHYSGANYVILSLLIEDVSGRPFADYMREQVFQPLHMTGTQYGWPPNPGLVAATPYDGFGIALPGLRYNELAAAGLATNLHDLAAFAAAALRDGSDDLPGRGVLRPETVALMQTPASNALCATHDIYGPEPRYGLGYNVRPEQFDGKTAISHGGSNRGWESFFQIVPSTGDGIVIMTNSSNGPAVIASLLCSWRKWAAGTSTAVACPLIDIRAVLNGAYLTGGAKGAVARYRELRRSAPDAYDFAVWQLNSMGYELLRKGDVTAAVEIFRLNVEQFPNDWTVYDSLGEGYWKQGDKPRAIENYRKSLQLNPENDGGRQALSKLGAPL
jgi:CubicO group peptidase (beta-lactamase class C family)